MLHLSWAPKGTVNCNELFCFSGFCRRPCRTRQSGLWTTLRCSPGSSSASPTWLSTSTQTCWWWRIWTTPARLLFSSRGCRSSSLTWSLSSLPESESDRSLQPLLSRMKPPSILQREQVSLVQHKEDWQGFRFMTRSKIKNLCFCVNTQQEGESQKVKSSSNTGSRGTSVACVFKCWRCWWL